MSRWYISQVCSGGVSWAVLDLTDENISLLRRAQEAWSVASSVARREGLTLSIDVVSIYWLDALPEGWRQPDGEEWEEVSECPFQALAETLDEKEPLGLSDILMECGVPTQHEKMSLFSENEIYFSCQVRHSNTTIESPFLGSDILDILTRNTEH